MENTLVITVQNLLPETLEQQVDTSEKKHIIIHVTTNEKVSKKDFSACKPLVQNQKKNKKSLVIVANADYTQLPAQLNVVPTLQEAYDIIEMEDIERDLLT